MNRPDPAAPFVNRFGGPDRRGDVPLHKTRDVPGLLPDPRWDGPRHAVVPDRDPDFWQDRGWAWRYVIAGAWIAVGVGMALLGAVYL